MSSGWRSSGDRVEGGVGSSWVISEPEAALDPRGDGEPHHDATGQQHRQDQAAEAGQGPVVGAERSALGNVMLAVSPAGAEGGDERAEHDRHEDLGEFLLVAGTGPVQVAGAGREDDGENETHPNGDTTQRAAGFDTGELADGSG